MLPSLASTTVALSVLAAPAGVDPGPSDCPTPVFAAWSLQLLPWQDGLPCEDQEPYDEYVPCAGYTYIPHPGGAHGWPATHVRTTCSYDRLIAAGASAAVMIRNRNCPFPYDYDPYTPAPNTIDEVLAHVPDMDFAFMDLEGDNINDVYPNMVEVALRARAVNPDIRIGNYSYFPGEYDGAMPFESQADRTDNFWGADLNEQYLTSGADVAMPSCYPYEYYEVHDNPGHYSGTAPNVRSGLFWAPLERLSVAKRDLPAGHLLIPWVATFIPWNGYDADPPPAEDMTALVQHFRLRGADAFYTFPGSHPTIDPAAYRVLVRDAWIALDEHFPAGEFAVVQNLATGKAAGVEWSAITTSQRAVVLASNLSGNGAAQIPLTLSTLLPVPASVSVEDGMHELFVFDVDCRVDVTGDRVVNVDDLVAVIIRWGQTGSYADVNGSGLVDVDDLVEVIVAWGPCP